VDEPRLVRCDAVPVEEPLEIREQEAMLPGQIPDPRQRLGNKPVESRLGQSTRFRSDRRPERVSEQLTLYVKLQGDAEHQAEQLAAAIRELESVGEVVALPEEPVRSGLEVIQEVTVTVTALGGAVGATTVLIGQIQSLLAKFRVKSAQVETEGALRQLPVGGAPRNENPAQ
jgi:hypothetical protein